jgi:hypothetical protein
MFLLIFAAAAVVAVVVFGDVAFPLLITLFFFNKK